MADIIVNNLPLNTTPDLEDVVLLIKNADGTLTRVSMSDIASLIGGGGGSSPSPYTSNPEALGTASPGSSDNYARGDHVHPKPFIPVAGNSNPEALGTASPGVSLYYAHADHVHAMPTAANVGAIAAPSSPSVGDFLVYTSNGWAAQSLSTWQGGSF